jgi:predicted RNA-binding protein YlxR (DUF448 family)
MRKKGHIPIRMCIGCRKKRKKEEMIRMAQSPQGMVSLDQKAAHRGRGFYLCPDLLCLDKAIKRNKRLRFLETMDFQSPSGTGFFVRGGRG